MFQDLIRSSLTALLLTAVAASPVKGRDDSTATSTSTGADPSASIQALQKELLLAASNIDRERILFPNPPDASRITFQFHNTTHKPPTGGEIVLVDVDNLPGLIGTNVGAAIGFLDGCGLNVPHSHPRANEFLTVVQGELIGGLVLEELTNITGNVDGTNPTFPLPVVQATLSNFTGMLFPQGLVHFQFNPSCEPATFAAAFDNSDSGRVQIANTFFSIGSDDVLLAALGGNTETISAKQLDMLRGHIPDAFAELMDTCAKKCGIEPSS